jgi:hypothetical protein
LKLLGLKSIEELAGRTDFLAHLDYQLEAIEDDLKPFSQGWKKIWKDKMVG